MLRFMRFRPAAVTIGAIAAGMMSLTVGWGGSAVVSAAAAQTHSLSPSCERGKCGYVDAHGAWVIPPRYDAAQEFSDQLAAVNVGTRGASGVPATPWDRFVGLLQTGKFGYAPDGKWGYVDAQGREVVPPQFQAARRFSENVAAVQLDGEWGYVDRTGTWVIERKFDEAGEFADGRAAVRRGARRGHVNRRGEVTWDGQVTAQAEQ